MVLTADQEKVKSLLTETIILLCKNGLHYKTEFSIEGLIGITIDTDEVFLVSIKETIKGELDDLTGSSFVVDPEKEVNTKRTPRRKRKRQDVSTSTSKGNDKVDSNMLSLQDTGLTTPDGEVLRKRTVNDSMQKVQETVVVKEECSTDYEEAPYLGESSEDLMGNSLTAQHYTSWNPDTAVQGGCSFTLHHHQPSLSKKRRQHQGAYLQMPIPVQHPQPFFPDESSLSGKQKRRSRMQNLPLTADQQLFLLHRIMSTSGPYMTVRSVQRRNSSYSSTNITQVMNEATKDKDDDLYVGEYKEFAIKNFCIKVFYKCPPHVIKDKALEMLVTSREDYTTVYYDQMKAVCDKKDQDYRDAIERNSPYVDTVNTDSVAL